MNEQTNEHTNETIIEQTNEKTMEKTTEKTFEKTLEKTDEHLQNTLRKVRQMDSSYVSDANSGSDKDMTEVKVFNEERGSEKGNEEKHKQLEEMLTSFYVLNNNELITPKKTKNSKSQDMRFQHSGQ